MNEIRPFDFNQLEPLPARVCAAQQHATSLLAAVDLGRLGFVASKLLRIPCEITLRQDDWVEPFVDSKRVWVALSSTRALVLVAFEPALAIKLSGQIVQVPERWSPLDQPVPAALHGALAAFVVSLARRTGSVVHSWRWVDSATLEQRCSIDCRNAVPATSFDLRLVEQGWGQLRFSILLGSEAFGAEVFVLYDGASKVPAFNLQCLGFLNALPLSMQLVAAQCLFTQNDLNALEVGGALCPANDWTCSFERGRLLGNCLLTGAEGASGMAVVIDGYLAQGVGVVLAEVPAAKALTQQMGDENERLAVASVGDVGPVGEARVTVRVELATVTLPARDWAQLEPGSVLATAVRVGEPVLLRAGGVVFARGELCTIDDELAVRVTERLDRGV